MKKTLLVVMLVVAMILTGCSGSKEETKSRTASDSQANNALNLAITTTTTTMDPQAATLNVEFSIINQIYEPLFYLDNDSNIVPLLADITDAAEDGSYVVFTLMDGITFQSGDTLTAEDVAYTFERSAISAIAGVFNQYATCSVVDEKTVRFDFPYAAAGAGFNELASYIPEMYIVNKSYCEGIIANPTDNLYYNCDGTGAYKFDSIDVTGNITLTRYEGYHGTASIDTVNYKLITGDTTMAFESGDIDFTSVTNTDYQRLAEYSNVATNVQNANYVAFTTLNVSAESKLNNMSVRQAVAYAMNREDIATIACAGGGQTAYNMANPLVKYYADCCDHYDRDIEKSQSLLTEAGYSAENPCELTLIVMGAQSDWVAACEVMKENLEESYFKINIVEVEDTTRYFTLDFDMGFIGVGLTTDFSSFAMLFQDNSLNLAGIYGDEQAAILEKFSSMTDEASTQEAMKAVVDTLAYIPCYYTSYFQVYDSNLEGIEFLVSAGASYVRDFSWKN